MWVIHAKEIYYLSSRFGGEKMMQSCPKPEIWSEAEAMGFLFISTNSSANPTSHLSALSTMKDWMEKINVP